MNQRRVGNGTLQAEVDPRAGLAARRQMLKRSLGVAAPVALTLVSAPVSAGQCLNASGFVSMRTFNSRNPAGVLACSGKSPGEWYDANTTWPRDPDAGNTLGKPVDRSKLFRIALGTPPLSGGETLQEVLDKSRESVDSYIVAAWLNAAHGGMSPPFDTCGSVAQIWQNIHANNGRYRPDSGAAVLDETATLDWLARTWS